MVNGLFVGILAVLYAALLWWGCRELPKARWQVLAAMPMEQTAPESWKGLNITFYGFFLAGALVTGCTLMIVMLGATGLSVMDTVLILAPLLIVCLPASRWVAGVVEKKRQTLTVAGASFVGLVLAPWITILVRGIAGPSAEGLRVLPVLSAMAVGYAFGEGLGRLACISFGCCYGKPMKDCHPLLRRIIPRGFVFSGPTKKISYESGLDGEPVFPIQAVTSAIYVGTGLVGLLLVLNAWFGAALILVLAVTQGWRFFSEIVRADFRGRGKLTAYQYMALGAILYGVLMVILFPARTTTTPNLWSGLQGLWNPGVLLFLQATWFLVLMYVGRSRVTASTIQFHVLRHEI